MTIGTRIFTALRGDLVGQDEFGNRYYQDKKVDNSGKKKRWVMFKGLAEPSKVPAEWHGWLHYTTDEVLKKKYDWQKQHTPNLSGTKLAYFPAGHKKKGGVRSKATGDYQAWQPTE
ncbi:MAG: dehydrogenase [Rickettsiaceae bacterium]|jgi:NADH:ubiquinone oxidoreductase subunit|nr:dehydrogenase [Rickettsiaceae bacterium]